MSLSLRFKTISGKLKSGAHVLRINFRGKTESIEFKARAEQRCQTIDVSKDFQWDLACNLDEKDHISFVLYQGNFASKIVGRCQIYIQRMIELRFFQVSESLCDDNHSPLPVLIDFMLHYSPGDVQHLGLTSLMASIVRWLSKTDSINMSEPEIEETMGFLDQAEACMHNYEEGMTTSKTSSQSSLLTPRQNRTPSELKPSSLKTLRKTSRLLSFLKKPKRRSLEVDESGGSEEETLLDQLGQPQEELLVSLGEGPALDDSENDPLVDISLPQSILHSSTAFKAPVLSEAYQDGLKCQDFQVSITILEARLSGPNIDPVVCIQIGDQKRFTNEKISTHCPYYNEYFVFDFHMPPALFLDQLIILSVFNSRRLLRKNEVLGSFKLDVGTVHAQQDRQFHYKWAVLMDPDDMLAGPKGYLKCNIGVCAKGETLKIPLKPEKDSDEDNIDGNLLLPAGVQGSRQQARYLFKVYSCEGLPWTGSGVMAKARRAITGDASPDSTEAFVEISFAGHVGRSSVQRGVGQATWNQQIVFVEMFPPLIRRVRIQLKTKDSLGTSTLGTHFLHLSTVSDEGRRGFLPTFGPTFINLYGSSREGGGGLLDKSASLNDGLGEGVAYKGRLLLLLKVDVVDGPPVMVPGVSIDSCLPISQASLGPKEEFLLFGCILDVSMLDKRLVEKPVHLEISFGNVEYGDVAPTGKDVPGAEWTVVADRHLFFHNSTPKLRAQHKGDFYCYIPYLDSKPCVYVSTRWEDLRWRMFHSNFLYKIQDFIETGLVELEVILLANQKSVERKLNALMDSVIGECCQYISYAQGLPHFPGMNKLDKERRRSCQKQMDRIATSVRNLKTISKKSVEEKMKSLKDYAKEIRNLANEPQDSLPDVFIWLMQGTRRLSYHRLPACDLIFSPSAKEKGRLCAQLQSFYLKLPGGKYPKETGWRIQAQVTACLWLGGNSSRKGLLDSVPSGFHQTPEIGDIEKSSSIPPSFLEYSERHDFELRCHLYQGRSLLAADTTGLSDPFLRVVFQGYSKTSQLAEETLNPNWDETLVIPSITLFGKSQSIASNPPEVVVEVFDQDQIGKEEFMGHVIARPKVKLLDQPYQTPMLSWFPVYRGSEHGGDILAAFELIMLDNNGTPGIDVPTLRKEAEKIPVPKGVRPILKKYKLEVLFWGLREMKRRNMLSVERPRVDIECAGFLVSSDIIPNYGKNPNFSTLIKSMQLELPENPIFWPAVTIRCIDYRSFGRYSLVGSHIIRNIGKLMSSVRSQPEIETLDSNRVESVIVDIDGEPAIVLADGRISSDLPERKRSFPVSREKAKENVLNNMVQLDWWSKYFASVEAMLQEEKENQKSVFSPENVPNFEWDTPRRKNFLGFEEFPSLKKQKRRQKEKVKPLPITQLKIYTQELEKVPEFEGFQDWITSFNLFRGRDSGEPEEERCVGRFKGSIRLCPQSAVSEGRESMFQNVPSNDPLHVLVRLYIIKADELHPMDMNGKADPYLFITLGRTKINDKENYISKQLNPVFGKCFEVEALFPQESQLCIQVYDWDLVGRDDLIGETRIDLEDRYYSRHRATCGLSATYDSSGYNLWRDPLRPTQILAKLCKEYQLEGPFYMPGQVRVGQKTFLTPQAPDEKLSLSKMDSEALALYVLRNWNQMPRVGCYMVPEHVETRRLVHPRKPGIIQGKLEMWLDMFPMDLLARPPVDISPRKPKSFELRVIIHNTDEVVLEDDAFFTGEKMSDIYVKGWLKGPEDTQSTDIHYRSLTGEGNFNWRFLFPFDFLEAEEKVVLSRRESLFSWDETELKMPPRLELQVWDADHFSADDFLGSLSLNLTQFPRGAKSASQCSLQLLNPDSDVPMINIFKQQRVKGWWPFIAKNDQGEYQLTGKVEAEFHLLNADEAEKNPAGFGRSEPNPLEKPSRPDSSFVWFLNPLKSARYILWHNYKWSIVKALAAFAVLLLLVLFIYNLPGYMAKKIVHA